MAGDEPVDPRRHLIEMLPGGLDQGNTLASLLDALLAGEPVLFMRALREYRKALNTRMSDQHAEGWTAANDAYRLYEQAKRRDT